jgi:hypothetical protein
MVEMRQEREVRVTHLPEAAVAFALSEYATREGPQFVFARVKFADLGPRAAQWKDKSGQPASVFQLGLYHLGASRTAIDYTHAYGGPSVFYTPASAGAGPGPWRRLEVEVRPEKFRAKHWDGAVVEMLTGTHVPRALKVLQNHYPDFRGLQLTLATKHSVGLFLEGNIVSLRRFDVEPLAEGE